MISPHYLIWNETISLSKLKWQVAFDLILRKNGISMEWWYKAINTTASFHFVLFVFVYRQKVSSSGGVPFFKSLKGGHRNRICFVRKFFFAPISSHWCLALSIHLALWTTENFHPEGPRKIPKKVRKSLSGSQTFRLSLRNPTLAY